MAHANYCDSIKFMDDAFIDMKTQSAKAKGRRLQQWFRDLLIEKLDDMELLDEKCFSS